MSLYAGSYVTCFIIILNVGLCETHGASGTVCMYNYCNVGFKAYIHKSHKSSFSANEDFVQISLALSSRKRASLHCLCTIVLIHRVRKKESTGACFRQNVTDLDIIS